MARSGSDLDGVVSFHGGLESMYQAEPGSIKAKILVCHGADDSLMKPEQVEAFKKEMEEVGADYKFIAYEGAKHSFTNPAANQYGVKGVQYQERADRRSWNHMKGFFEELFQ